MKVEYADHLATTTMRMTFPAFQELDGNEPHWFGTWSRSSFSATSFTASTSALTSTWFLATAISRSRSAPKITFPSTGRRQGTLGEHWDQDKIWSLNSGLYFLIFRLFNSVDGSKITDVSIRNVELESDWQRNHACWCLQMTNKLEPQSLVYILQH